MLPIKQNLTLVNYNSANKTNKYIVVHYTGNSTDTAYNNTRYFKSVNRNASAHYFVDDTSIWQCVQDKDVAWHCGDRLKSGNGGAYYNKCTNYNSIGVEMCCTNYDVSMTTENNTIDLVQYLMKKYNIPASNVIRHYDVTNKICPKPMVDYPDRWTAFKKALGDKPTPTPSPTPSYTGDITYQSYDNVKKQWLPEVINDRDYAGNFGNSMGGIRAKCKYGTIYIQTHIKGGKWLSTVNSGGYIKNDTKNGNSYSGIYGKNIDGVKIWSSQGHVDYRVHIKGGNWLAWVHKADSTAEGYAGIYGKVIDSVQMR